MKIGEYETNPAADCFGLITGQEFKALKSSIERTGLLNPVVLDADGRILDGRNRARACIELGREFKTEQYQGDDPAGYVAAGNVLRRHLSTGERAVAADKLAQLPRGGQLKVPDGSSMPRQEAASMVKVSKRTVARVAGLREGGRPDLYDAVGSGDMTAAAADRRMRRDVAAATIREEPAPLPDGPFRVVVADPPWRYEKRVEDASSRGKAEDHFETMTFDQIAALPVGDMAHAEGCVLWLWTTNAHIFLAGDLCELWGFVPKTVLTWDKESIGTGDWLRGQTEHCVMAVRGKAVVTLSNQSTSLKAPRREHSRKPDEFYELVDGLCPGSKVELFARQPREGYVSWGAESNLFAPG